VRQTLERGYDLRLGEANILFKRNNRDPQEATDPAAFRAYDRDNNSYIDEKEAGTNGLGKAAFAAMDADGDGKVFKGEFSTFMDRQNAAASARLVLEVSDSGQDLFDLLDIDQDGALSPRELRSAKEVLNTADKNGDGVLNGDEIPQRLVFELVRGAEARTDQATANQGPRRPTRSTATASTSGPLWFRKMDRNNDGDLSPHEFLGPRAAFEKLDANRDGLVDREEAEAADK
jgi:Ca2+-binding EF-hand superfamily protein